MFLATLGVLSAQGFVLVYLRPLAMGQQWKGVVEGLVLCVSAVAALANLVWYVALEQGTNAAGEACTGMYCVRGGLGGSVVWNSSRGGEAPPAPNPFPTPAPTKRLGHGVVSILLVHHCCIGVFWAAASSCLRVAAECSASRPHTPTSHLLTRPALPATGPSLARNAAAGLSELVFALAMVLILVFLGSFVWAAVHHDPGGPRRSAALTTTTPQAPTPALALALAPRGSSSSSSSTPASGPGAHKGAKDVSQGGGGGGGGGAMSTAPWSSQEGAGAGTDGWVGRTVNPLWARRKSARPGSW